MTREEAAANLLQYLKEKEKPSSVWAISLGMAIAALMEQEERAVRAKGLIPEREMGLTELPPIDKIQPKGWWARRPMEQPQWISVEDEKPKSRGHYFIAYKFAGSDMRFYGEAIWHDDIPDNGYVQGDHFSNEGVDGMYVTHWMEIPNLPAPPKEEVWMSL